MGGNVSVTTKSGKKYNADRIDLNKWKIPNLRKDVFGLLDAINKKYKKEYKKSLWKRVDKELFNGSTSFIMDDDYSPEEIVKYKPEMGDCDVVIPIEAKEKLWHLLKGIEEEAIGGFIYLGNNKATENVGTQINALFRKGSTNLQIDFECAPFVDFKPTEWAKFGHSSSFEDCKQGIKALHHKLLLRALTHVISLNPNIVIATPASKPDKIRLKKTDGDAPRMMTFSVDRGLGFGLVPMTKEDGEPIWIDAKQVYQEVKPIDKKYIQDLMEVFKFLFPDAKDSEIKDLHSFVGVIKLIKKHIPKGLWDGIRQRYFNIILGKGAQVVDPRAVSKDADVKTAGYDYFLDKLGLKHPNLDKDIEDYYKVAWKGDFNESYQGEILEGFWDTEVDDIVGITEAVEYYSAKMASETSAKKSDFDKLENIDKIEAKYKSVIDFITDKIDIDEKDIIKMDNKQIDFYKIPSSYHAQLLSYLKTNIEKDNNFIIIDKWKQKAECICIKTTNGRYGLIRPTNRGNAGGGKIIEVNSERSVAYLLAKALNIQVLNFKNEIISDTEELDEIVKTLENHGWDLNAIIRNINSILKELPIKDFSKWEMHWQSTYTEALRAKGSSLNVIGGKDKWCPADIYLVNPNKNILSTKTGQGEITDLAVFNNEVGSFEKVIPISLKKSEKGAMHGKIAMNSIIDFLHLGDMSKATFQKLKNEQISEYKNSLFELVKNCENKGELVKLNGREIQKEADEAQILARIEGIADKIYNKEKYTKKEQVSEYWLISFYNAMLFLDALIKNHTQKDEIITQIFNTANSTNGGSPRFIKVGADFGEIVETNSPLPCKLDEVDFDIEKGYMHIIFWTIYTENGKEKKSKVQLRSNNEVIPQFTIVSKNLAV